MLEFYFWISYPFNHFITLSILFPSVNSAITDCGTLIQIAIILIASKLMPRAV